MGLPVSRDSATSFQNRAHEVCASAMRRHALMINRFKESPARSLPQMRCGAAIVMLLVEKIELRARGGDAVLRLLDGLARFPNVLGRPHSGARRNADAGA